MEWKYWLWVVLIAFLLGGLCECEGCWDQEKTALLQLKPFFTHIDDSVGGKQSSNCCEWEKVECNTSTGRVIRLFLNLTTTWVSQDLVYTDPYIIEGDSYAEYEWNSESERYMWYLNASLFLSFDELKSLYLSGNSIAGCVDNQGFERLSLKLDKLEILDLSYNNFNDSILSSLSELSSLKSLYLAYNQITGSNPTEGIKRLSELNKLETLDLRGNILGNNILSHLHGFTSLKSLRLQSCRLNGTVDMLEFNNLMNLKELYLGRNEIESLGSLFQSKGQLRLMKLEVLGLSDNLFNNSIFSSLAVLSNLKSLYIGGNNLKEAIHIQELNALMKLEVLGLSNNLFNNSIFSSLAVFSNLKSLYINQNQLKGAIHIQELNALRNLVKLDMSYNEVNDFVPSQDNENELRLMSLEVLDLSENLFNNSILSSLGRLSNLKSLSLNGENLEGSIDLGGLYALTNLEELYMGCYYFKACSFSLQSLSLFPVLKTLYLYGFSFDGTLTTQNNETGQRLMNLEAFHLSGNFKNSSISSSLGRLSNLKSLSLSCRNSEGSTDLRACSFPLQSLSVFPLLKTLFLYGFSFYGTMDIQNNETELRLMNLEVLVLNGNLFNSSILPSFGRLSNLKSLSLECQNFEESTDLRACNFPLQPLGLFPRLKTLFLYGFSLSGTLTTQKWTNLTSLEELTLQESYLPSNLIQNIGVLTSLKSLQVIYCYVNDSLNLDGPLHFKNLESFSMVGTSLKNNFLQKIGATPSLKYLALSDCGLNGTLNTQGVCEFTNLQGLDISNNNLEGNLPECFSNLTSLENLDLSSNQFFGNIYALEGLTSLEILDLSNNYLEIPSSLGPLFNLSKLRRVYMDSNTIYADSEMLSLAPAFQLNGISLSCCGDVGPFPQFLYHQHDLQSVDLSNINLTGEFPNWLLENNSNLEALLLSNNSLFGHFELTFHSHKVLSYLGISKNSFYGNIPNEIGAKLPSLQFLNMSKNNFSGSIPDSIGDMNSLEILDLSNNILTGGVPEHLAMGCFSLNSLILSNNRLQGQMFSSNFNLINLRELQLDGNHFSGKIPDCLSNSFFLSKLHLSNNQLFGNLPSWMGNMSSLEEIDMSSNHLEGPIPMEFCQLNHKLKLLDLSVNNISGSLPSCFSPLWISEVHLSRNKLQGPLTNAFRNSTILVTLDLSKNQLTGTIPNWIDRLSQLSYLLLNNNHFEGGIPIQLCNLGHLSLINLSNNNLSGTIPPCLKITTLNDISQDYVRYVLAVARAPSSFSIEDPIEFTTKNIPYAYKGKVLMYLSGIDLSCNKLIGEIPHEVKNFQKIFGLNLSHNSLTGPIPPALSDLRQIESLDLSYNNLSGKIPSQLVVLYFLSVFSVAYNNFSGSTPERIAQFATFEERSYLGNPFLCGTPLPKCLTEKPSSSIPKYSTNNGSIDMNIFYVSFVVSYIMVLLGIASVLYINPYWRRAWFYHIEAGITSCYYFVIDNLLPKQFH